MISAMSLRLLYLIFQGTLGLRGGDPGYHIHRAIGRSSDIPQPEFRVAFADAGVSPRAGCASTS
jgi:hypothetical protein